MIQCYPKCRKSTGSKVSTNNITIDRVISRIDYLELTSNSTNDTNDVIEIIPPNKMDRSFSIDLKADEHDKTNEQGKIYTEENNKDQNLQLRITNKSTKDSNTKPYGYIIGDSVIEKTDVYHLTKSINRKFVVKTRVFSEYINHLKKTFIQNSIYPVVVQTQLGYQPTHLARKMSLSK